MIIKEIELNNYRNYEKLKLKFNKNINIIIGDNAQGKTNILEAIYFLSVTKSYRTNYEENLIKQGTDYFKIKASIKSKNIPKKLEVLFNKTQKSFFINKEKVKKMANYIGNFNVINITPEDIEILKGSPSIRRNIINIELSQIYEKYIEIYNEYNKLLKIRNDYLKELMTNSIADDRYLDIITDKLIERAVYIYQIRKEFIDSINERINVIFEDITNIKNLKIDYQTNIGIEVFEKEEISKKMKFIFHKYNQKEISLGMTIYGPHRDDFIFNLDTNNIRYFGSQGQQKLAIISFKLCLLDIYKEKIGSVPVLLLDDIFSELDKKRKNKLIDYINHAGQVIITTNDIRDINRKKLNEAKIFEIKNKKIIEKGDKNGK